MGFADDERTAAETRLGIARGALFGKSGEHGAAFTKNGEKIREFVEGKLVEGRYVGPATAQEIAVDVQMDFVAWYRRVPKKFIGATTITALVCKTMFRKLSNLRRERRRRAMHEGLAAHLYARSQAPAGADEELLDNECRAARDRARKRMTPAVADVESLRWIGHSCREIAETLDISVDTVKTHLKVSKEVYREELAAGGYVLPRKREVRGAMAQPASPAGGK